MTAEVLGPSVGHGDEPASRRVSARDETSFLGGLPHWQSGTRRAPHVEHFGVGPRLGAHPLQEVEDQGVNGVGHSRPAHTWCQRACHGTEFTDC